MAFDPTYPPNNTEMRAAELRSQLNALNDKPEADPVFAAWLAATPVVMAGLSVTSLTLPHNEGAVVLSNDEGRARLSTGLTVKTVTLIDGCEDDNQAVPRKYLIQAGWASAEDNDGHRFGYYLPTSDPQLAGALWNDAGTVKISAGP